VLVLVSGQRRMRRSRPRSFEARFRYYWSIVEPTSSLYSFAGKDSRNWLRHRLLFRDSKTHFILGITSLRFCNVWSVVGLLMLLEQLANMILMRV
jgi:hypothetical protein